MLETALRQEKLYTCSVQELNMISKLTELLTAEERESVKQDSGPARPHPLGLLLSREEGRSQHAVNVERALRHVSSADMAWIMKMKSRIVGPNVADSASALAELRAYGMLLEAGYKVAPVAAGNNGPTPEFEVSDGTSAALVEVHAKQFDAATEKGLQAHRKMISEQPPSPGVTAYEHAVHPFGKPVVGKAGDSTVTNAISRICAIKQKEHQFREGTPSILWLDFQDLYNSDMALTAEQFEPLISWNEHITSGALWYALYGWKGAPILEQCHYSHLDLPSQIKGMAHNGRFLTSKKLSAVIVSLPKATILAESPRKAKQLPVDLRLRYLGLPWAGIQHTIAEWTDGLVVRRLKEHAILICGIVGRTSPLNYPISSFDRWPAVLKLIRWFGSMTR